ncbi:MAG: formate/nitrite transporter family protein [SAR324 cluster bacterium]
MERRVDVPNFDALVPAEIALKAEEVGVRKANLPWRQTLVLSVLAGAFIALGALFSTTTLAGAAALPYGVARLLAGLTFCLGLILVVLAGAELFTGNNLIVMAYLNGRLTAARVLRNWALVYVGNLAGAMATAALVFLSGQYAFGGGSVGLAALAIGTAKCGLGPIPAFFLGVLCNALVCLAVWLTMGARTAGDKLLVILFPIAAFVAAGFEHSVANMYFLPLALLIKSDGAFLAAAGKTAADYGTLTWAQALLGNLLPVTLGNIVGGAGLVGAVYGFVYSRPKPEPRA